MREGINRPFGMLTKFRQSRKIATRKKKLDRDRKERSQKDIVKSADRYCRFPLCGCRPYRFTNHVAHLEHKGWSGDAESRRRSMADKMILLCPPRHRENMVALDAGSVDIAPRTGKGTRGPCDFYVEVALLRRYLDPHMLVGVKADEDGMFLVARERAPHQLEPLTSTQRAILVELARMDL